ncbi:hypothetical protein MMC18_009027 [Xylographa bjoerkii]|nr:hypothetical protein [Xylographa bjoerkii]
MAPLPPVTSHPSKPASGTKVLSGRVRKAPRRARSRDGVQRPVGGRPSYVWTPQRARRLIRLYTMTPLNLTQIAKVLEDAGFQPKDTTLRSQLTKLLGESYHHYQTKDRTVMEIRLAITKLDRRSFKKILESPEEDSIAGRAAPQSPILSRGLYGLQESAGTEARFLPAASSNNLDTESTHRTNNSINRSSDSMRASVIPLTIPKAITNFRQVEGILQIGEEENPSPWTSEASSDVTLADTDEHDARSSNQSLQYIEPPLYANVERVSHDLERISQRHAQFDTYLPTSQAANYPLEAPWATKAMVKHLNAAIHSFDAEPCSAILSSDTRRVSFDGLKKRLRALEIRSSVASSSLSLIHSVMNASISDSARSSLRSSVHSAAMDAVKLGNNSRYRRPGLRPLLKVIDMFSNSKSTSLPARQDSALWKNLVETRQLDDALVFLSPLTSSRKCCSVSYLLSGGIQRCPRCGLTLHHYWALELFPFSKGSYFTVTGLNDDIDLHTRDFFNNTTLHYLAASEIDIDSKLPAFFEPTAPITAVNYLGQTFLHLLNPKSLGQCLRRLPEFLQSLAKCSFPFNLRDYNGETFLQTLLQHQALDAIDYDTIREILRITTISVHSGDRRGRFISVILQKLLSSIEARRLRDEFTLDHKGLYHFFDNERVYDFQQLVRTPSNFMMWRIQSDLRSGEDLSPSDQTHEELKTLQLSVQSANPYELMHDFICRLDDRNDVNWVDVTGETLLGAFAQAWQKDTQYSKDERDMIVRELVLRGADCNILNSAGDTPLFIAIQEGQDTVFEIILKEASVRPQSYACVRLVSTAHKIMGRARKMKDHDLEVSSMRIIALLGAEIVKSSGSDIAQNSPEISMGHAKALRSTLVPKRDPNFSRYIDPSVLTK